ncbi:MAG: replication initiator protein A [Pseudomonadota bacterium]|nr:replication initiator protein A [Pseudomonadota bacterium]
MGETTNQNRTPLLPDRHQVGDFFVCDIFDAAPKGDMASMEHPIYSISTKPDRRIRRYENGHNYIEIQPSAKGLATVHDRDVLIFCISQIMAAVNQGCRVERTVRLKAYDLLVATNRPTGGESYARLKDAFERLRGTTIVTNIITGEEEITEGFGLIDRFRIVRETRDGRMLDIEITLSDWVFNAIRSNEVLTISRDYFRLRKPLERRLYELARKHCGTKASWKISLELLQRKCGSNSSSREFRRLVSMIVRDDAEHHHIPDYSLGLEGEYLVFQSRGTVPDKGKLPDHGATIGPLDPDTYETARALAPGWDVYVLEQEWRAWMTEPPRNPDAAFLGFCRKRGPCRR